MCGVQFERHTDRADDSGHGLPRRGLSAARDGVRRILGAVTTIANGLTRVAQPQAGYRIPDTVQRPHASFSAADTRMADLLTPGLAAAHQLTVVHYYADFETAATVLMFQHRWALPRGSV